MNNKVKEIDIKSCTYCFFDNITKIKNLDPNKIDEKSYKNILIITLDTWQSKIATCKLIV